MQLFIIEYLLENVDSKIFVLYLILKLPSK